MNIMIRDTNDYDGIINKIGNLLKDYKLSYVEAYGVLECVKIELADSNKSEEE